MSVDRLWAEIGNVRSNQTNTPIL